MAELGYQEGRNFTFDYIQTPNIEGYEKDYRELAARQVDVFLAVGNQPEAAAGFQSRRGLSHDDSAPVTPHNAPFQTYKAARVHHAARRRGGGLVHGGARAAGGPSADWRSGETSLEFSFRAGAPTDGAPFGVGQHILGRYR